MGLITAYANYEIILESEKLFISNVEDAEINIFLPSEENYEISVHIHISNKIISVICPEYDVSKDFISYVMTYPCPTFKDLSEGIKIEISTLRRKMSDAVEKCMQIVKYFYMCYGVGEDLFLLKDDYFTGFPGNHITNNNLNKYSIPMPTKNSSSAYEYGVISTSDQLEIQQLIDKNVNVFFAMRYLHNARLEKRSSYAWIDATIAAELAIKEMLAMKSKEIESIIFDLPSPPLDKLYGSILEKLFGYRSKFCKKIARGSEIRNKLVHRPLAIEISDDLKIRYLRMVEAMIFELLGLLYKDSDPIIKRRDFLIGIVESGLKEFDAEIKNILGK